MLRYRILGHFGFWIYTGPPKTLAPSAGIGMKRSPGLASVRVSNRATKQLRDLDSAELRYSRSSLGLSRFLMGRSWLL